MVSASDDHRPLLQPEADETDDDEEEAELSPQEQPETQPTEETTAAIPTAQHPEQDRDEHGATEGDSSGSHSEEPTAPTSAGGDGLDGSTEGALDGHGTRQGTGGDAPAKSPSVSSPPYWMRTHAHASNEPLRPTRVESVQSPGAITLEDNEQEGDSAGGSGDSRAHSPSGGTAQSAAAAARDRNRACWARSVEVTDFVMVNGSATNIGAFAVWNIRVRTLSGPYMNIRKRYSEFDDFRKRLIQTFPNFEAAVPELPPKSVMYKFRPAFLEKRRAGLQYFLNCILLNPEFSGSPVLSDFLFA